MPEEINYQYVIFQSLGYKFAVNCKYALAIEKSNESAEIVLNLRELIRSDNPNDCLNNFTNPPKDHNIILQINGKKIGITADIAESIEYLDEIQELPPSVAVTKYIKKIGLSKKNREIIFILEPAEFV